MMATSSSENVQVVCRCRPFSEKEKNSGFKQCVTIDTQAGSIALLSDKNDKEEKTFTFDAIFDETSKQVIYILSICVYIGVKINRYPSHKSIK